jgi:hypothetical protein
MDIFDNGRGIGGAVLVSLRTDGLPLVINRSAGGRSGGGAGHVAGEFADELLERRDGRGGEIRTGDGYVGVEIGDGALQRFGVLLHPLR